MHILLIHQSFVSPDEPGGTRHYEFARHMVEHGHQFTIVASDLSYLTGQRTVQQNGLVSEQDVGGVRVLRASTYKSLHRSFAWRVVSFLSFMMVSVYATRRVGPVDLVIGTSPPIFQSLSAWFVARLRRCPFVLEIRDLWPEFAIDLGVLTNPLLITLSRRLEHFLYKNANHIVVNSPAYEAYLLRQNIEESKISFISNGVSIENFGPNKSKRKQVRELLSLGDKFVVTYTGAMGLANDIDTILQAASNLRHDDNIHFLLVGDGKERTRLQKQKAARNLTNVTFAGPVPKSDIPGILDASDACLATLKDIPMFRTTYPNKVFDYMAASRPTILAIDGVIRDVIETAEGGVLVPPGNASALSDAISRLSQDRQQAQAMGSAAREYVAKHFNRKHQAAQFAGLARLLVEEGRMPIKTSSILARWYPRIGKRLFDLSILLPLIIVLFPVLALIALLVRLNLGAGVFFCQLRSGLHGKPFKLIKFRTMTESRGVDGELLPDAERLTPFGLFLRNTSLDELPELFHVITGDMSLVGPRPLVVRYLDRYSPEQARRLEVRPGITGLAQISGRNALTWEEKFACDARYVDNLSLWFDVKIMVLTLWKLIIREGINEPGQATAQEFWGNAK